VHQGHRQRSPLCRLYVKAGLKWIDESISVIVSRLIGHLFTPLANWLRFQALPVSDQNANSVCKRGIIYNKDKTGHEVKKSNKNKIERTFSVTTRSAELHLNTDKNIAHIRTADNIVISHLIRGRSMPHNGSCPSVRPSVSCRTSS